MAPRRWAELGLGPSARLKRVGWEHFLFEQRLFHRSDKPRGSSTRSGGVAKLHVAQATAAPGKAPPSSSHHIQQTAFMASRKITWHLFPPHDKHFRDTYSSPAAYTNARLRQRHTQARAPCSSPFLPPALLRWYSEASTASSGARPAGTESEHFNR